jgi:hypothetical protein
MLPLSSCEDEAGAGRSRRIGDVTAVALSIGEPYSERALNGVQRQTYGPMAVVRIVDLPF